MGVRPPPGTIAKLIYNQRFTATQNRLRQECARIVPSVPSAAPSHFVAFRTQDPDGNMVVLAEDITRTLTPSYGELKVRFESLFRSSIS